MPPAATPPARRTLHNMPAGWKSCPDGQHSKDQQQKQSVRTSREVYEMAPKGASSLLVFVSSHTGHRLEGTEILSPDCHFSMEVDGGSEDTHTSSAHFYNHSARSLLSPSTRPCPATVKHRTAVHLPQQPSCWPPPFL